MLDITTITIEEEAMGVTELEKIDASIEMLTCIMEDMEIKNQKTMEDAGEWLVKNKTTQKIVKDFFEPERARTYEAYKAVTDEIKKYTDMLTKAEKVVKKKMAEYQMEQDRIRREKEEKLRLEAEEKRKAAEESGEPVPETMIIIPEEEPEKIDGVSFVENWTFTIDDTDKIPREYMIPDEKKIRQVVKAMKGDTNIPGIKAYAEKTVRARG